MDGDGEEQHESTATTPRYPGEEDQKLKTHDELIMNILWAFIHIWPRACACANKTDPQDGLGVKTLQG